MTCESEWDDEREWRETLGNVEEQRDRYRDRLAATERDRDLYLMENALWRHLETQRAGSRTMGFAFMVYCALLALGAGVMLGRMI